MRNKRPELDLAHPPGQIVSSPVAPDTPEWNGRPPRYLRDIVKAAQERSSETPEHLGATMPSPDAEKRLERLVGALKAYIRENDDRLDLLSGWEVVRAVQKMLEKA